MSRKPSEKTQLANAKREINRLNQNLSMVMRDRDLYRVRATKAEQEAVEWKKSFDKLLEFRQSLNTTSKQESP